MKGNRGMKVHSLNGLVLERYNSQSWVTGFPVLALLVLVTLLLFISLSVSAALAVSTPLFVTCTVDGALDASAGISVEQFAETVVVKGMTWEGTASCSTFDASPTVVFSGNVKIQGTLLTEGTLEAYKDNPGVLSLKYSFLAEDGSILGGAEGFVTLAKVSDFAGTASFQGEVSVDGEPVSFYGTGSTTVTDFTGASGAAEVLGQLENWKYESYLALEQEYQAALAYIQAQFGGDPGTYAAVLAELNAALEQAKAVIEEEYQLAMGQIAAYATVSGTLTQTMGNTVLTASKPGYAFETANRVPQLNRQYVKAKKDLMRQRLARLRVLRAAGLR